MKTINQPIEKYLTCAYCDCRTDNNICIEKEQKIRTPNLTTCRYPQPKGILSKTKPRVLRSVVAW